MKVSRLISPVVVELECDNDYDLYEHAKFLCKAFIFDGLDYG